MDTVLSFLISTGIIVFGGLIVAGTITVGAPMAWTFMGLLPLIVGCLSLYHYVAVLGGPSRMRSCQSSVERFHFAARQPTLVFTSAPMEPNDVLSWCAPNGAPLPNLPVLRLPHSGAYFLSHVARGRIRGTRQRFCLTACGFNERLFDWPLRFDCSNARRGLESIG
jgi:hypothetical protein